jgi:hypothetical protein
MTAAEMLQEHPLELEAILAGQAPAEPEPGTLRRRRRVFLPVAGLLALALLVGLYWFVTFEQTALETVSPPPPARSRSLQ